MSEDTTVPAEPSAIEEMPNLGALENENTATTAPAPTSTTQQDQPVAAPTEAVVRGGKPNYMKDLAN